MWLVLIARDLRNYPCNRPPVPRAVGSQSSEFSMQGRFDRERVAKVGSLLRGAHAPRHATFFFESPTPVRHCFSEPGTPVRG